MPVIQLSEVENPRVVLGKIAIEISAVKEELEARARILEELLTLNNETAVVQAAVAVAKTALFQLLSEQLRSAQVRCVEEYCDLMASEIKAMEEQKDRKGKSSP